MFRVCRRPLTCICPMTAKSVSTCSNSTVCDRFWTNRFSDNFNGNRRWFIPVSLLSILNRFHTFLWFHCWFWTIKCQPGGVCFVKRKFQIAEKQVWITFSSIIDSQWEVGDKELKNVRFSEIWRACFVFLLPRFWDSPFCHITDELKKCLLFFRHSSKTWK